MGGQERNTKAERRRAKTHSKTPKVESRKTQADLGLGNCFPPRANDPSEVRKFSLATTGKDMHVNFHWRKRFVDEK